MEKAVSKGDIVILGNRVEGQLAAIELDKVPQLKVIAHSLSIKGVSSQRQGREAHYKRGHLRVCERPEG